MDFPVSRGKKVAIAAILLTLFCGGMVIASGQKEDPIATARDLIIRKRLNDAILLLTETVRKDPKRIDEAESLMQTIRNIRGEYFTLWQELIKTIKTEPDKPEKALAIIEQMKKLDAAPNERTRQNIAEWQNIVQFRYNLNKFDQIMVAGDALLKQGKYSDAIQTYVGGFDIFREEFLAAGFSKDLVVGRASSTRASITRTTQDVLAAFTPFENTARSFSDAAANAEPSVLETRLSDLSDKLAALLKLRNTLIADANLLDTINAQAHLEKPKIEQNWYLVFLTWYIRGRPELNEQEGILAAVSAFLNSVQANAEKAILARANSDYTKGVSAFDAGTRSAATQALDDSLSTAKIAFADAQLWSRRLRVGNGLAIPPLSEEIIKARLADYLLAQNLYESILSYQNLIQLNRSAAEAVAAGGDSLQALVTLRTKLEENLTHVNNAIQLWQGRVSTLKQAETQFADTGAISIANQTLEAHQRAALRMQDTDAANAERIAEMQVSDFQKKLAQAESTATKAEADLNGEQQTVTTAGGPATVTYRYPDRALEGLQTANASLKQLQDDLSSFQQKFGEAASHVSQTARVKANLATAEELQSRTAALLKKTSAEEATAQKNVEIATSLRARADRALQEARVALTRQDIETAIQRLQDARQYSLQALDLQHDQAYSDSMDQRLAALSNEVKRANYVRIVQSVRDLIDSGRTEYQQDRFAQAEADLLKAKTMWATVSPNEPQQEVENWLRLVQAALNLQNTRELTETDPLYFTLGNYLNRAKENFAEGKQLYTSGNQQEAKVYLAKAEENIQSVVVARPFNQEARVLSLRIIQLTNPAQFPSIFKQRFDEAVNRSKSDPRAALVDMYDLRAIDANFPGLQAQIARLEIDLGIRPNPVTVARKQESDTLVAEAQKLAATGDRTQTQVAIVRLEKALALYPDNRNAQVLLDRYHIALGSPATYTLPSTTMQLFSQAENLFVSGRIADALAIVDRIWQNPANRGFAPLVDLRNNILSRLGQ